MSYIDNKSRYIILCLSLFSVVTSYAQETKMDSNKEIPTSIIKIDNITLNADLSKMGNNASILFYNKACIIIGLDGYPVSIIVSPEFNPSELPLSFQHKLSNIKIVFLRSSFVSKKSSQVDFEPIPSWLQKFEKLEYLTIDNFRLNCSLFKEYSNLKYLFLQNIHDEDKNLIIENITKLESLKFLIHNYLFTPTEVCEIEEKLDDLTIMLESEYDRKIKSGEIYLPKF